MHNNIMVAGSKDRPPMLATGRYPQWRSQFLRYIDTRSNGDALRKCILNGPYIPTTVIVQAVAATDDSPAVPKHTTVETPMNMSSENKAYFESEKEVIHRILTGIGDEIYSIVDAFQTTQEMWEAIERLQQGESLNIQDPEWSRFVTIVKKQHKLDEVSYHKLFDILKQYQKEVNELCAERLARNTNPQALFANAQANQDPYYQTSKSQKSYAPSSKASIPTRSHITTRYKCKEIDKLITPLFEPTNNNLRTSSNSRNKNVDTTPRYKNDNQSGQFRNQRKMNVVGARENVGSPVVQQYGIQCFNCKEFGHFAKECRKPKRVKDSVYHKEKMLLCKQAEKGVLRQAEQYDWLADTDEEIDEQYKTILDIMCFANEIQHSEQSESISNTCIVETDDSNVIRDSPDMFEDDIQNDQNDVESDDERIALANLIANLKLDVDENKKIQKKLKKANTTLAQELKECKTILAEISKTLGESSSVRDRQLAQKYIEIKEGLKLKAYEISVVKEKHDELIKQSILTKSHYEGLVKQRTKMPLALKTQNDSFIFVHELKQEMHAGLKYVESLDKEIDELKSDKAEFSNMYDMIIQEFDSDHFACVTKMLNDVNARTKKPNVVPISTRIPKGHANKSVATPHKKKVASKSTTQKPKSYYRMRYEKNSKAWKWWIEQQCLSGYKWVPKTKMRWIVQLTLFIVDSGCTKHMTGNLKLLCNFVKKYLGTVRFGNDQFAPILGYRDLVQGNITISKVYNVEGLNHNLFSVGQFCDADLEVAFWKSTCFVRDLQGNDLVTGNRGSVLYIISLQELTSSTPLCLMAKASPTQAWLWHRILSHLNFDYINLLSKKDVVIGLPKLKLVKDQLCSSCESKGYRVYNKRTRMIVESIHIRFDEIKEVSETPVANNTSCLVPQRQKASNYDNRDPVPQRQDVYSSTYADVPSQQELDLLFGPLYDEFFNAGSNTSTNIPSTLAPPAEENNNDQA
nr:retrovirus-related Pol polyprotein from transposon TNT 1-94 [Tanacetum cinerariifolium]